MLETPVGTDISRPGDVFVASLVTPVVDPQGNVLIPQGSRVMGQVAGLRVTYGPSPAAVALDIQSISIGEATIPLSARVIAANVQPTGPYPHPAPIVGGATEGAILGAILGGGSGALEGAAIGAAAGTLISLGTSPTGARLPSGTLLAIELTQPIPISPS